MSRSFVRGKDVNLYVKRDGSYVFTACATSFTKEETAEDINITTADSAKEREYIGGAKDATISIEGVVTLDRVGGFQYKDFIDNVGNVVEVLITYTNVFNDDYSYECDALITSVSDQANVSDFATFSVNMKRSGAATTLQQFQDALLDSLGNYMWDSNGELIRTH